jgi:hypothetical protein
MLKAAADLVTSAERGAGVAELMNRICREDAGILGPYRHGIAIGKDAAGNEVLLEAHRGSVLIAGHSGIGKSTIATALTERMVEKQFQFCILDPEGDYGDLENAVSVGDPKLPPSAEEALTLLRRVAANVVVNTLALELQERPGFFAKLLPDLCALRARTGRPHWLIFDEAHHLLPAEHDNLSHAIPKNLPAAIFITVHPDAVSPEALGTVDTVIALGTDAPQVIEEFCRAIDIAAPKDMQPPAPDQVLLWQRSSGAPPQAVKADAPKQSRKRHTRKYAEGDMGEDKSFYFRGPDGAMNLRAQNLMLFLQMAEGVDDRTWDHHLRRGDYSRWFRDQVKDEGLAAEAAQTEQDRTLQQAESRARIKDAVLKRYTAPAPGTDAA